MSWFPSPVSPRAAFADLRAVIRSSGRERWIGGACAVLVTIIIVIEFLVDSKINTAPPPRIVYAQSWSADRTDAEIIADQKIASERLRKAKEAKKQQFRDLEKQLGM